jgi:hypothetical protein
MRYFRISVEAVLALCLSIDASAQAGSKAVAVLAVPEQMRHLGLKEAEKHFSVPYLGHIDPERRIYVRVFLDSLQDLRVTYPQRTRPGQCVVYAHTGRFLVGHANDGRLIMDDLVDYIDLLRSQETQNVTLVFEEGEDEDAGKPLYLQKGSVETYFGNAMELPVIASSYMRSQWRDEDRARAQPKETASSFWGFFKSKPVYAAPDIPAAAASPAPAEPKWPKSLPAASHDCARATAIPFRPLPGVSEGANTAPAAFSPIAERAPQGCSN